MENPLEPEWDKQRDTFFVGETCMRGPLVLHIERLRVMKYWDEHHFFLEKTNEIYLQDLGISTGGYVDMFLWSLKVHVEMDQLAKRKVHKMHISEK